MLLLRYRFWLILSTLLLLSMLLALHFGAFSIDWSVIHKAIFGGAIPDSQAFALWQLRLPRLLLAGLVGAGLAVSGAAVQGLFRNPLAEPGLIGVMGGSMLFAVIFLLLGGGLLSAWMGQLALSAAAFLGGLLGTWLIYLLSGWQRSTAGLLLAGIAITALTNAVAALFIYFADDNSLRDITFWTMGSLSGANWTQVAVAAPLILGSTLALVRLAPDLNLLMLGEQSAQQTGLSLQQLRRKLLFAVAVNVGACIAVSGMIGFVGLVVPHLLRLWKGAEQRRLLPASALLGASLLILADTLARTVLAPVELPIGVLTALIGAPFFFYLLHRLKTP